MHVQQHCMDMVEHHHNQNVEWNIAVWILLFVALCMHECTLYDAIMRYCIFEIFRTLHAYTLE